MQLKCKRSDFFTNMRFMIDINYYRVYVGHLNKTDAVAFLDAGVSQLVSLQL